MPTEPVVKMPSSENTHNLAVDKSNRLSAARKEAESLCNRNNGIYYPDGRSF